MSSVQSGDSPRGDSPGAGRLGQERLHVERPRHHRDLAVRVARPFLAWAVAVELDAVSVRVAQVERLADAVVGGTVELDPGRRQPAQRVGQGGAIGIAHGDVVETRVPGGGGEPPSDSQVLSPMWWW